MFTKKYRPKSLEDMVGSLNVRNNLSELIKKKKLKNCMIFYGDNGIGKTSLAYTVAYYARCGCGVCDVCQSVVRQLWENQPSSITDIYEFDLGKHREDSKYIDKVLDTFQISGRKVIILDEIQALDPNKMPKFLKTFETISDDTYLIICTTELWKINTGIISRCELYELTPPTTVELASHLETICRMEGVRFDREGLYALAKVKFRVRDAVNSLESIIDIYGQAFLEDVREYLGKSDNALPIEFLRSTKESSPYALMGILQKASDSVGIHKFSMALKETVKDCMYARYGIKPLFQTEEQMKVLRNVFSKFSTEEIACILETVEGLQHKNAIDKEISLIRLGFQLSNGTLLKKIGAEEEAIVKRSELKPQLEDGNVDLQDLSGSNVKGFQLDSPSELGVNNGDSIKITGEEDLQNIVNSIFKGSVLP